MGASRWVPACSMTCHQNKLNRSFLKSNSRCSSIPGLPMKVGNSADMVWVRSTTLLKLLASDAFAGGAGATNPAAAAPLKKPRRLKAARTFASHPATHMFSPSHRHFRRKQFWLPNLTMATGVLTQAGIAWSAGVPLASPTYPPPLAAESRVGSVHWVAQRIAMRSYNPMLVIDD